jgi:hypothetical protein
MFEARSNQGGDTRHLNLQERGQSRPSVPSANSNSAPGSVNRSRISPEIKDANSGLHGNNAAVASSNAPENPTQPNAIPPNPPQQPSP